MTTTTKNKPGRPSGPAKKETASADKAAGIPKGADKLSKLKRDKTAERKKSQAKTAGGVLDKSLEVLCDGLGKSKPYFKLASDEKKMLSEANTALADVAGMQFLNDPKYIILFTYGLVFGPRILTLLLEIREKRQQNIRSGDKRKPEPDNTGPGEKGSGQDAADLEGISAKNR